jgi:hypothetical protein
MNYFALPASDKIALLDLALKLHDKKLFPILPEQWQPGEITKALEEIAVKIANDIT